MLIQTSLCWRADDEEDETTLNFDTFISEVSTLESELSKRGFHVFLHMGETWQKIGLDESLKRTEKAILSGVKYLGHATSTWCHPDFLERILKQSFNAEKRNNLRSLMIDKKVMIETCPTSNYWLNPGIKVEELPIYELEKSSAAFCICRDDPGIFADIW